MWYQGWASTVTATLAQTDVPIDAASIVSVAIPGLIRANLTIGGIVVFGC